MRRSGRRGPSFRSIAPSFAQPPPSFVPLSPHTPKMATRVALRRNSRGSSSASRQDSPSLRCLSPRHASGSPRPFVSQMDQRRCPRRGDLYGVHEAQTKLHHPLAHSAGLRATARYATRVCVRPSTWPLTRSARSPGSFATTWAKARLMTTRHTYRLLGNSETSRRSFSCPATC